LILTKETQDRLLPIQLLIHYTVDRAILNYQRVKLLRALDLLTL